MSSEEADGPGQPAEAAEAAQWGELAEGELDLTDPKAMRALAHPVRMALLELFEVTPALTATQASEALGESPANCAFHLRTLAKYGFIVEAGGGKGRERPWAVAHRGMRLRMSHQPDKQAELAATALAQLYRDRILERIRRALTVNTWPEGWASAVRAGDSVRFLTALEAADVTEEIWRILARYADRQQDPSLRPPGALPVQVAHFVFPLTDLADLSPASEQGREDSDH